MKRRSPARTAGETRSCRDQRRQLARRVLCHMTLLDLPRRTRSVPISGALVDVGEAHRPPTPTRKFDRRCTDSLTECLLVGIDRNAVVDNDTAVDDHRVHVRPRRVVHEVDEGIDDREVVRPLEVDQYKIRLRARLDAPEIVAAKARAPPSVAASMTSCAVGVPTLPPLIFPSIAVALIVSTKSLEYESVPRATLTPRSRYSTKGVITASRAFRTGSGRPYSRSPRACRDRPRR